MASFLFSSRGDSSPKGKPRVFFTCHPDDFSRCFEAIRNDIFKTHDCTIYYTKDLNEEIEEQYKQSDLGQMNLFVIPVTLKLLIQPNRAMDSDFRYAQENHIPVLPIMMEPGLDMIYSQNDKFGQMQYLNPLVHDLTAISYEEKLKKYLDAILISDEMVKRIRKAFDAYVFLSYRKKDRHYANELMKAIHSHPEFRDIAIWYDEFLTLGESFQENIEKMMNDSKLFMLLVTPSLLEQVNGEPNYVMSHEYPSAKNAGMDILPTEMEETDKGELCSSFDGIPDCVRPDERDVFKSHIVAALSSCAISENNNDPEHNYLIGLAYLEGIDIEKDTKKGIELITLAAEANLVEAMEKLFVMYREGADATLDYRKAAMWAQRISSYYQETLGDEHPDTLSSLGNLASAYDDLVEYKKALELNEKVYALKCKVLGGEHPETLKTLSNIAHSYSNLGEYKRALELNKEAYRLKLKVLGNEHHETLISLNNLASTYSKLGDYKKALEMEESLYALSCKILGNEHPDTIRVLNNIAAEYSELGNHERALELSETVYALGCKVFGNEHPNTISSFSNIASIYGKLGNHEKALELNEKIYALRCKIFGNEHPDTLASLNNLASNYSALKNFEKALEMEESSYVLHCKILGGEHPTTLMSLNNLASSYYKLGNYEKALELEKSVYELECRAFGSEHPETIKSLNNIAYVYSELGDHERELEIYERVYALRCKVLGKEHPTTLGSMNNLIYAYHNGGQRQKAKELYDEYKAIKANK